MIDNKSAFLKPFPESFMAEMVCISMHTLKATQHDEQCIQIVTQSCFSVNNIILIPGVWCDVCTWRPSDRLDKHRSRHNQTKPVKFSCVHVLKFSRTTSRTSYVVQSKRSKYILLVDEYFLLQGSRLVVCVGVCEVCGGLCVCVCGGGGGGGVLFSQCTRAGANRELPLPLP